MKRLPPYLFGKINKLKYQKPYPNTALYVANQSLPFFPLAMPVVA